MKKSILIILTGLLIQSFSSCSQEKTMNYNKLTPEEERVIIHKGTEMPHTGKYDKFDDEGRYNCKQCDAALFTSTTKFNSGCGWPSFDDAIKGAVKEIRDADGRRTEIVCANCDGHLGHVFRGEGFTDKNTRHCVNSVSLDFVPVGFNVKTERAIFASGCFWGTEYYLQKLEGVISTTVGYTGGHVNNPTYKQVCTGSTGHAEAVEVIFDPEKVSYETLVRLFFETHDFTQVDRQGPDIGTQYRSAMFYIGDEQKVIIEKIIDELELKNFKVATEVAKASEFYIGEEYHQDYYDNKGGTPYCHFKKEVF